MSLEAWQQWGKRPEILQTLFDRAKGLLPEMESTKQLVRLVSKTYRPGMRILDVGCNAGHFLRGLRRIDPVLDYTGIDAYEHYIKQAKAIFAHDCYAHFEVKDVLDPFFPDKPFEIVFCCNVILHLPDFRLPVRNLLASTKEVLLIRTLLGEDTTIVKRAMAPDIDEKGNPRDFVYENTWQTDYFVDFVNKLGWNVELIPDEFDPSLILKEYQEVKKGKGTRILGSRQVDGNIIFNWVWAQITPA